MAAKAGFKDFRPDGSSDAEASAQEDEGLRQPSDADLARDWITLWQSELNALAADPDAVRSWRSAVQTWSSVTSWFLNVMAKAPAADDNAQRRRTGPKPAARPPSAVASSDARDDEIARLTLHISQLERRLADLERGVGGRAAVDSKRRRKRDV